LSIGIGERSNPFFPVLVNDFPTLASDGVEGRIASGTNRRNESARDDDARKRNDGETLTCCCATMTCNAPICC